MKKLVVIAVCTYKRKELLYKTLKSINQLQDHDEYTKMVMVIDNECSEETRKMCLDFGDETGLMIEYHQESTKGISSARNKALNKLPHEAEWLAFIDDDEVVDKMWLR